jgi:predicted  nucleic acid-binding Zn-ribbon protein
MQIESVQTWTQLVINVTVLAGAAFAFWNFLVAPLRKDLTMERDARKSADAHRDERTREITRDMTTAIGRVEMLERRIERSEDDRRNIHGEINDMRATQVQESDRLREAEIAYERTMGEIRTAMAQMESKLEASIRQAIREAARMGGLKE